MKILLFSVFFSILTNAYSFPPDIQEPGEIGITGGSIMAEDTETDMSVTIFFPEGAVYENTMFTLILHGTPLPEVLGKTHIKGITVLPAGLFLHEEVQLEVYNPPVDVTKKMILYRVVNQQFIMPLCSHVQHEDENRIEGTFYITGNFSMGTPTASESVTQCKKHFLK